MAAILETSYEHVQYHLLCCFSLCVHVFGGWSPTSVNKDPDTDYFLGGRASNIGQPRYPLQTLTVRGPTYVSQHINS